MTTPNNLLRLRLERNIEAVRDNLNEMMTAEAADKRRVSVAKTRLEDVENWADRALPAEPETKVNMGAADDPRARS